MNAITIDGKLYIGFSIVIKGNTITIDGELICTNFESCNVKRNPDQKPQVMDYLKAPRYQKMLDRYKNKHSK